MNKKQIIKEKFRNLLEIRSLDEISVLSLCKECNINRQIFYYHYKSITDVLYDYFLEEKVPGADTARSFSELIHCLLMYSKNNRQLVLKTMKSKARSSIETFFYDNLYSRGRIILKNQYKKSLKQTDIDEIAKLMSDTLSREMLRLLSNPLEKSIGAIEEEISKTFDGVLDLICKNKSDRVIKSRSKKV